MKRRPPRKEDHSPRPPGEGRHLVLEPPGALTLVSEPTPPPKPSKPTLVLVPRAEELERQLVLPPSRVRRLPGGLEVWVESTVTQGLVHKVLVAAPAVLILEDWRRRRRGEDEERPIPYPLGAHCRPCKSATCVGAQYARSLWALYEEKPIGWEAERDHL